MPDVQEVFRMATQKVRPEPGFADRQFERQRRRARNRKFGALAVAATLGLVAIVVAVRSFGDGAPNRVANAPEETPIEVATGFVEAYGAFDADRAIGYLAADAGIRGLTRAVSASAGGTPVDLRRVMSMLDAQRYEQTVDSCRELSSSASEVSFRCSLDVGLLGSGEIGLGPYTGTLDVTVSGGRVVTASVLYSLTGFEAEMWVPFAEWLSSEHPEDVAIMYVDDRFSEGRLSAASIRLWDRRVPEYVEAAQSGEIG